MSFLNQSLTKESGITIIHIYLSRDSVTESGLAALAGTGDAAVDGAFFQQLY